MSKIYVWVVYSSACMSNPTAPGKPDGDSDAPRLPAVEPADVPIDTGDDNKDDEYRTEVFELMTPRSRGAIVDALLQMADEPRTAREIADAHSDVTVPSFNRHRDALRDFGVLLESEKRGNAQTYRLNTNHPTVQLLGMINQVYNHGTTPPLLDEKFYRESDF